MVIISDMDDVLDDLISPWVKALNETTGSNLTAEDITCWDLQKFYPNLSREEIVSPLFLPSFWETVKPVKDSIEYLFRLKYDGHKVLIVTASHFETMSIKYKEIILGYFPYMREKDIFVAHDKSFFKGDVIIDDNPDNLGTCSLNILFDAPHNRSFNCDEHDGFARANGWKDVYSIIKKYEEKKGNN